ncbi:hypothetical protein [Methylorubrum aminovorans]|uniref:hypothetical protein n=1 Tax=Methylorubrum aminovorans TaxID=269069 RepID=UPI003C2C62A4
MAEIIRFPSGGRVPATTIPRAEFERLAELALDVVDRIILLLDDADDGRDVQGGQAKPISEALGRGQARQCWTSKSDGELEDI